MCDRRGGQAAGFDELKGPWWLGPRLAVVCWPQDTRLHPGAVDGISKGVPSIGHAVQATSLLKTVKFGAGV